MGPALLVPPVNVLRCALHPGGLASRTLVEDTVDIDLQQVLAELEGHHGQVNPGGEFRSWELAGGTLLLSNCCFGVGSPSYGGAKLPCLLRSSVCVWSKARGAVLTATGIGYGRLPIRW